MTSLNRDATIFALLPMISGIIRKPDSRNSGPPRRLADALEAEGFQLSRHAGGIPNAFIASFGEGKPVIALLGEFDALAGLSQQAHSAEPTSATPGENGHGCGHNLLGTAAFAAAVAAKQLAAAAWRLGHPALLRLPG